MGHPIEMARFSFVILSGVSVSRPQSKDRYTAIDLSITQ